ncbi:MAG: DUF1285 domain-containing protein [Glaciecola sp.]
MDFASLQKQIADASDEASQSKLPNVDKWDPPFCGNMNLVIKRNGQWWHEGTPFTRAALISLLSSVLKKESDDYFLVTPVEKIGIQVEDVPFVVINDATTHNGIQISTQTGDTVTIGEQHPVELRAFEGNLLPYCHIRRNLWARVHQNVLYRWLDKAEERNTQHATELIMQSGNYEFCIGKC